ncbi:MAG TPA: tyrosine-type recombinase/integrase [Methanocellales archaeon]|nr:tyrosine-type recombinase/integrase [Methanocellales archaeon]
MAIRSEEQAIKVLGSIPEMNRIEVKKFDLENKARGLTISTRLGYLRALSLLTSHVTKPFSETEKEAVVDWVSCLDRGANTVNLYKACIKRFFQWFYDCERREYPDVVKWITTSRAKKSIVEVLTLDEVKRMAEATTNQRDRALIMALYESAARADELLKMKIRDIKIDRYGAVCMVNGKTGIRRIRLVDAVPDIQFWMNMHPEKDNPDAPLWIAQRIGYDLKYAQFHHIVVQLGRKAGIKKDVHPHLLRHSRLTELATKLTDSELKVFAGWGADSRMPGVYIHLSGADIDKKILSIHGLVEEEEGVEDRPLTPKKCPRCEIKNPPTAKFCYRCSAVLDIKTALEMEEASKAPDEWMEHVTGDKEALFAEFMEFMEFKKAQMQKNDV